MEFSGLVAQYPRNRPLTEQERCNRLNQKERLHARPHYQLSVVTMNSTYLESVDKWFAWKGMLSAVMLTVIGIFVAGYCGLLHTALTRTSDFRGQTDASFVLIFGAVLICPLVTVAAWILCKESFAYTHYPIRFNRKTRWVHVFRTDGTVLSVAWDDVFFTLGNMPQWNEWEVRGHVLDADNVTVKDTFALSYVGCLSAVNVEPGRVEFSADDFVRGHWEFIRRYMEDGPQAVSNQVQFCMPIDGRRESIRVGTERVFANISSAPFLLYWILFPFCLVVSLFRVFAMRTSKVPRWPAEVEAASVVDPDDPYAITGDADGERVAVFPEAAAMAGVKTLAGG